MVYVDNYYNKIKDILTENEVYKKVKDYSKNRHDLMSYYEVGKLLIEAQGGETRAKYGDGLIKEYSKKLLNDIGKKYDVTTLKRMRQFYLTIEKGAAMQHQLSWNHYKVLLPLKNINKINYYINISLKENLGYRDLYNKIKQKEYERLPNNTKNKLITHDELKITDLVKDPIIIKTNNYKDKISEKILQQLILEDIPFFLKQLGDGFTFIDNEYKIIINNKNNYIDLLLFNIKYNCYVVIELKVTELKKEYIGQIEIYKNYIDEHLKTINQNNTIGIIVYKDGNNYLLHYSTDSNIFASKYITI